MSWHPKIVAFCCNWCAYAGADFAGISRIQYSPDIRILRVMCSGRVDPALVLKCYERGADGVMVLGCHPGDCRYIAGNEETQRRVETTRDLMELLGIDPRRLLLEWISASEGERFANVANEFVDTITGIGPSRGDHDDNH